jgi:hypothetical protein
VVGLGVAAAGVALSSDCDDPALEVEMALLFGSPVVVVVVDEAGGTDEVAGVDTFDWARNIGEQTKIKLAASTRIFIKS